MATTAKIEANRENAKKSRGPVTPEGRAASSQNNRHGLRGRFKVLPNESQELFDRLLGELREEHQPSSMTEELLVFRMAQHHWLAERARGLVQAALDADDIPFKEVMPEVQLWMRYETSNQRAFHKCLNDLLKLKAETRKLRLDEAARSQRAEDSRNDAARSQRAEDSRNGFERQKREDAAEVAKQAAKEAKTRLTNTKAETVEHESASKALIQAPLPAVTPLDVNEVKQVISDAIGQLANQKQSKIPQRA